jgi:AAA domain
MDSSTVTDHDPPDKPDFSANPADSQTNSPNGHGDDKPFWAPELVDAMHEKGRCYVVADVEDADRMNRYGLLTLAVPEGQRLTRALLQPVKLIEVLQRPGDQGAVFGLAIKRRLLELGWYGEFNRGTLFEVQADTAAVERDCGGDRALFGTTILGAFDPLLVERLHPPRRERQAKTRHPAAEAPKVAAPETFTGSQLLAMEFPEPKAAIKGLVVEGTNIVAGRPKEGKSFMVLDWCLAVAAGGYALGDIKVAPGDALYVGLEDSYRRIKQRVEARLRELQAKDPTIIDRFHCRTDWPALDQGGVEALGAWLDAHPHCRLVAFDVLQAIAPRPSRGNGSAYADDYRMLKGLHALVHARGIPTVLVCHTTKARHDNIVDEINATLGLAGKVDTIIVLSQAAPGRWVLKATGRDIERQELAVRFDPAVGTWVKLGDAKEHAISDERKAIIGVLKTARIPLKPVGISELLGKVNDFEKAAVRRLLFSMLHDEQVQITEDGRYTLPPPDPGNAGNGGNASNGGNAGNAPETPAQPLDHAAKNTSNGPQAAPGAAFQPTVTGVTESGHGSGNGPQAAPGAALPPQQGGGVTGVTDISQSGQAEAPPPPTIPGVPGVTDTPHTNACDPGPPLPTQPHTRFCGGVWFWRGPSGPWRCGNCQQPKPGEAVAWHQVETNGQGAG